MMRLAFTLVALVVALAVAAGSAAGQETLQAAKDLYAAAAYEDALKILRGRELSNPAEKLEAAQYEVFCLIALDRLPEAEQAVEHILDADPLYSPDVDEASPRVVQMFDAVRVKAAPALATDLFTAGKAALERQEREIALQKFELLLKVIERSGDTDSLLLSELKLLAVAYAGLVRGTPAARSPLVDAGGAAGSGPTSTGTQAPNPTEASGDDVPAASAAADAPASMESAPPLPAGFVPPVPLTETLPAYDPRFIGARAESKGSIRLKITAEGRVESAEIVQSIQGFYDRRLLDAAARWRYRPATLRGVPIASERTVVVQLKQDQPTPDHD